MAEIYQTVVFLDGRNCEIILPKASDYSRAVFKYQKQNQFDMTLFLMAEMCLIDGQKKDIDYWSDVMCDDYLKVLSALGTLVTPIQ